MSIKLKNKHLMDQSFLMACASLDHFKFPVPVAYNVSRMNRQLQKALKDASDFYIRLLKDFCELDEQGNFVPRKNEAGAVIPNTYIPKEGEKDNLEKALADFMDIEVDIKSFPIKVSDLQHTTVTPDLLSKLDGIVLFE